MSRLKKTVKAAVKILGARKKVNYDNGIDYKKFQEHFKADVFFHYCRCLNLIFYGRIKLTGNIPKKMGIKHRNTF